MVAAAELRRSGWRPRRTLVYELLPHPGGCPSRGRRPSVGHRGQSARQPLAQPPQELRALGIVEPVLERVDDLIDHVFASRRLLDVLPAVSTIAAAPGPLPSVTDDPRPLQGKPGSDSAVLAEFTLA